MAVPTQATEVLSEEQITSFEQEVIAKGVQVNNWWAKQVAAALHRRETAAGKRDLVQSCLEEVRHWRASASNYGASTHHGSSPKPTTVEAWKLLVEDWQRGQQDLG